MPVTRNYLRLIVITLLLVVAASGQSFAQGIGEESVEVTVDIPEGYALVAENATLQLFLDAAKTQFIVVDRRTNKIWRTNPPGPHDRIPSALWRTHADSQLTFSYTDAKRRQIRETDPLTEGARVTYEPIMNGVRVVYTMPTRGFTITTDYILGRDYLEVRIPDSGFKEEKDFYIVHLELLPFFGAATDDDEGYMVFPDSSGAIAPFTRDHGRYAKQFEEYVYGPEDYPFSEYTPMQTLNRQVPMPIFGLVHADGAFLGVITEGEYDAKIVAAPSGYIVDYYRTNAKFVVRREYLAPLRRGANVQTVESSRIRTDRAVRYYILDDTQASYAGMALRYREHLIDTLGLQPGRVTNEKGIAPIHIKIFHAVLEERILFDNLIVLTTFQQAREMVERLLELGVENFDVTLVGWTKNGYAGRYPRRLPVESAIGGERGLRDFVRFAEEHGIRVYLQDNYIDAYEVNGGFSTRRDVARTPAKLPITGSTRGFSRGRYLISPLIALESYAARDIPQIAKFGVAGLDFERFGWNLLSDRSDRARAERADVAAAWSEIVRMAREHMGGAIVQGGNIYMLPLVDKVTRTPMEETTHLFASRSIPFYQIAIHGIVPYYGWNSNLRSEPDREFLKSIEYGALPIFELTAEDSSLLKEAVRYNILFSSKFDIWVEKVLQEYNVQAVKMGYLQDIAIVDHRMLDEDVFETVYEDGSRVIVNYRSTPWEGEGVTVGALDYVLIEGGIGR